MMNYVTYDNAGVLTGGFCQDLQLDHRDNHIEVTDAQRQNWTAYRANAARDDVILIDVPVATHDEVAAQKRAAIQARIDAKERETIMNRVIREKFLLDCIMRDGAIRAAEMSAELGREVSVEEALATSVGFVKVKMVDDQIAIMRAQMAAM